MKNLLYCCLVCLLAFQAQAQTTATQTVASGKSNPVMIKVTDENTEFRISKIYAVVVGVSRFTDTKLNLNYADDDAKAYYDFLKSPAGGAVPDEHITLLLNEKATRANIIRALNRQFRSTEPEDMIIIYMASHGVPASSGNKLFFLGADTDIENLEGTGVSQQEFNDAFVNAKATKKVWIADVCHAGTVIDIKDMMRSDERAASNMVHRLLSNISSHDESMIILSASSAGETSRESKEWGGGHGVFTYYLLQGLKGAADTNKNGLVDIKEAYEYLRSHVATDTKEKQFPLLNGKYSKSFPMSAVMK